MNTGVKTDQKKKERERELGVRGGTVQTLKSFACQVNKCEFYLAFGAKKKKKEEF